MFGLHLRGGGLGIHTALLADWSIPDGVFVIDENIYIGMELVLNVGASLASVPVGIGVTFRFDRTFSRQIVFLEDFRPYLFIGIDSFLSSFSARGNKSGWN
jgi:hypothetical protein